MDAPVHRRSVSIWRSPEAEGLAPRVPRDEGRVLHGEWEATDRPATSTNGSRRSRATLVGISLNSGQVQAVFLWLWQHGLPVGFPVDYRYGWDLNDAEHQSKVWKAIEFFKPGVIFVSPKCTFYSATSNTMDPQRKLEGRIEDEPCNHFFLKVCQRQAYEGRGFGAEQPGIHSIHRML